MFTRDGDVLDHFVKFCSLLTFQYQGLLFADSYAEAPGTFETRPMPRGVQEVEDYFEVNESFLLHKKTEPYNFLSSILPASEQPVLLTCVHFGGSPPDLTMS